MNVLGTVAFIATVVVGIAMASAMISRMNKIKALWIRSYAQGKRMAIAIIGDNHAFSTSLVGAALGIVILAIVVMDVAIPVITSAIQTANLTGTSAVIANLVPMFLILGLFVMVAMVFVIRWL